MAAPTTESLPPPQELSPEMQAWSDRCKRLEKQYCELRDEMIAAAEARARNSNQGPDDVMPLKKAAGLAGCDVEWLRRKFHDGKVDGHQAHKDASVYLSLSSALAAVKTWWGR
jgi:hypothetical protein